MTEITPYQQVLLDELHFAWLRLYQTTIAVEDANARKQLLFAMTDCLRWNKLIHVQAMKVTLEMIYAIASRELLSPEFYQWLEKITSLVSELDEPNA